jgi:hypothetical protein
MVGRACERRGLVRPSARALACVALLACVSAAQADVELSPPALSFTLSPAVSIPLGPGAEYFLPGGGAGLAVEYTPPSIPMLSFGADVQYGFTPIASGLGTTSQVTGLLGAAWRFPVAGRLSARVFASGGYGFGLIHGDPLSEIGGGPVVEGGAGLSFVVSPAAAARLDASYLYLLGANGSLELSIGLSMRPRFGGGASQAVGTRKASLEVAKMDLQSVYPALRRSTESRPVGTVTIRNTGKGSITDLHVSLRVTGFMESRRESAVRRELPAGDSWDAPLVLVLGPGAGHGKSESVQGEVVVTWVEQGEPWETRKTAMLRILEPHVIGTDDLRKAAVFVLPFDPSVANLAAAMSGAVAEATKNGVDPSVSAAIATREALRLLGIRITAGSDTIAAETEEGMPVRHVKYPSETLRDLSGTSGDVAVLCASLLEAAGRKAALIEVKGKMLVAVGQDDPAGVVDPHGAGGSETIRLDGHTWLPFETDRPGAAFRDAIAAGMKGWKAAEATGSGSLVPVREAWALYPPSPFPQGDSKAPVLPSKQLEDAVRAAIADFLGTAGPASIPAGTAPAVDSPARRLLVVFQPHPAGAYSEVLRASLADSLALSLRRAVSGVMVIPYGNADFPGSTDRRIEVARDRGADCYVVVGLSGDAESAVITTESFDLLSRSSATAPATLGGGPATGESGPDWAPVVALVAGALGKGTAAEGR